MIKNNKGFSSLVSLVSKIDSDDQFNEKIGSTTASTEKDIITEPRTNDVTQSTTIESPRKTEKVTRKPESSLLTVLAALVVVVGGLIWWSVYSTHEDSSSSPSSYSNLPKNTQVRKIQKPEDSFALQKNYPLIKPRIGKNNVLTVSEIKWCLSEKGRLKLLRQSLISVTSTSANKYIDFNDLILDFNKRCAEYRYKEYDYNLATWQIKNGTIRTSCYDDNIENGNEKFKKNDIVTSISFYKKAYSCAASHKQKIQILGSLAEAEFRNDNFDKSRIYIEELLSTSPENKWAADFVIKLDNLNKVGLEQGENKSQKSLPLKKLDKSRPSKKLTKQIQEMLTLLGYKPGYADGIYGKKTGNAIKQFQRKSGLDVTGEVTDKLLLFMQKKLKQNKGTMPKTNKSINQDKVSHKEKVAVEKLTAKKAEYHRKWREAQNNKKQRAIENQVLSSEKRENLNTCLKYADTPTLCKQHLLTQGQKAQVLKAQKQANLNTCLKYADTPTLCKQHLLTQGQKAQVLKAQKQANLNTCLKYADTPTLCKQHLLTQGQKAQVLKAQKQANLNTCLKYADTPTLCKQHLLTQGQKAQVQKAQRQAR